MPTPAEALTTTPVHKVTRPVLTQSWTQLTHHHWPYDPVVVRPFLPRGVEPDLLDGTTWVGLVPFAMRRVGVLGARLPYVSSFLETNVRVYGVDEQGRRSVVFLSLDADRLLPVVAAQAGYRLPYVWSSMSLRDDAGTLTYTARRRVSGVRSLIRVRAGIRQQPGVLDNGSRAGSDAVTPVVEHTAAATGILSPCPGLTRSRIC